MAFYSVGVSSYPGLAGRTQYVTNANVAAQVRSLIEESRAVFAGGAVLSVNEGVRSKADQAQKLAAWRSYQSGGPWAPLAASPLYSSSHDETRGSALDFGVTMPDGRNRAMTMSEQAWVVARGQRRGIKWTGRDFRPTPETWHFNGGHTADLLPLPEPKPATPEPPVTIFEEEGDMLVITNTERKNSFIVGPDDGYIRAISDAHVTFFATRLRADDEVQAMTDSETELFFSGLGIPDEFRTNPALVEYQNPAGKYWSRSYANALALADLRKHAGA